MSRIAFLGPEGTVSQEAAVCFFRGESHDYLPFKSIPDVFMAVESGRADWGVIPIENTIEGSVRLHMDWLIHEAHLPILAEWTYPSMQNLIGRFDDLPRKDGAPDLSAIRKIVSIDVAIAQCRRFLRETLPNVEFEYVSSTAEGVRMVRDNPGSGLAAIGTKLAAQKYGLDVLAHNITDHQNNFTRFILVGKDKPDLTPTDKVKTTIIVTLPEDYPGALHQVLSAFAWRRINLSKIESRPTKLKLGSYYFYIDVEASMDSVLLPAALAEIEALGCQVRILGCYPCYPYESINLEVQS